MLVFHVPIQVVLPCQPFMPTFRKFAATDRTVPHFGVETVLGLGVPIEILHVLELLSTFHAAAVLWSVMLVIDMSPAEMSALGTRSLGHR